MAAADLYRFIDNVFKTPKERRRGENFRLKGVRLEELWLLTNPADRSDRLTQLYTQCKQFIAKYVAEEAKEDDPDPLLNDLFNGTVKPETTIPTAMEFDMKLAKSVVPEYDGTPKNLRDFLDCARYYNESLTPEAQKQFLTFLLKVKLKQTAKVAIPSDPADFSALEAALKVRFRPKTTIAALQQKLSALQQNKRSVHDFASEIEKLTNRLTELQVTETTSDSREVIQTLNEQFALTILKKGANSKVQPVLLASQAKSFAEGVTLALEAEANLGPIETASVNYIHRGNSRGRFNGQQNGQRGGFGRGRGNYRATGRGNWRGNNWRGNKRGGWNGSNSQNSGDSRGTGQSWQSQGQGPSSYEQTSGRQHNRGSGSYYRPGNGNKAAPPTRSAKVAAVHFNIPSDQSCNEEFSQ